MNNLNPFLIKTDNIITGFKNEKPNPYYIFIEEGKIKEIGLQSEIRDSLKLFRSFNYPNCTALPGLVDGHTHMIAPGDGTGGDDIAKETAQIVMSGITSALKNRFVWSLEKI